METQRISATARVLNSAFLIPLNKAQTEAIELTPFFTVGRDPGNNLVMDDLYVSGRHARIEKRQTGYFIRDQNSRNGTTVNGARVTEAQLNLGDELKIGETTFLFSEAPVALQAGLLKSKNGDWDTHLRRLPAFAVTDFPVLITGPSGSGKEILAQWIHEASPRATGPFICINCSALSETLIESELFGHAKGGFTGATHDRKGAFESARGGTLFLDEIGDLPLALQPKLLRALENREIRPVGSDRAIETDVRILAATHKNLPQSVRTGRFREDLYYRLNVCAIRPPALTERMEDFEDLVYQFAKAMKVRFSFGAIETLKDHSWPGNVRELKNVVARAAAYFPGRHIQSEDIEQLLDRAPLLHDSLHQMALGEGQQGSLIKSIEREMILQRLIANHGNQRKTAIDLGLPKSTLHDRIKAYEIDISQLLDNTKPVYTG